MRVGVIGPSDIANQCVAIGREHPEVQFVALPYSEETQALDIFEANRATTDVFLFTGNWGYYQIVERYGTSEIGIPLIRVFPGSGSAFYRHLARMFAAGMDPRYISIDGPTVDDVRDLYNEVGLDASHVKVLPGDRTIPREVLVNFHLSLWRQGKTQAAITYMKTVYDDLVEAGVRVYRGSPSITSIRAGVARAALEVQALKALASQIVVGLVCLDQSKKPYRSTYEGQRIKSRLYQELVEFSEQMGASLVTAEQDRYALFTTRGTLAQATSNHSTLPLLKKVQDSVAMTVSVGFGIAPTANQSQVSAEAALHMCRDHGGNVAFIVYHDGRALGPIGGGTVCECQRKAGDLKLSRIASLAGLSVATISRICSVVQEFGSNRLTAEQLAKGLGIASRNGRRILMHLVEAGVATVDGVELPGAKGRPRRIYLLKI